MSGTTESLAFSTAELADLQAPGNAALRREVSLIIAALHDLVQRYTGSMFLVRDLDESAAAAEVARRIEACRDAELRERLKGAFEQYRRLGVMKESHAPASSITTRAGAVVDDLVAMWSYATLQPGYLVSDPREARRAAG